jgi:hypothetical protein
MHGSIVVCFAINAKPISDFDGFHGMEISIKSRPSSAQLESSMFTHRPDAATQARLHDQAKTEAERLRRLAIQQFGQETLDDFWRGADAVYQRCLESSCTMAERSASRLRARLARRARERDALPRPSGI